MRFELTSPGFAPGAHIPEQFTCDGDDISPPLQWGDPPPKTQSFALIMDDPNAPRGAWVHWVLFNLPADIRELPEQAALPPGAQVGHNSWGRSAARVRRAAPIVMCSSSMPWIPDSISRATPTRANSCGQ